MKENEIASLSPEEQELQIQLRKLLMQCPVPRRVLLLTLELEMHQEKLSKMSQLRGYLEQLPMKERLRILSKYTQPDQE